MKYVRKVGLVAAMLKVGMATIIGNARLSVSEPGRSC